VVLARHFGVEKVGKIMSSKTPFFKAFGPLLFGRPERKRFEKLTCLQGICFEARRTVDGQYADWRRECEGW